MILGDGKGGLVILRIDTGRYEDLAEFMDHSRRQVPKAVLLSFSICVCRNGELWEVLLHLPQILRSSAA